MATYNGDRYEVAENLAPATEDILTRGLWDGKLRVCVDEWTAATQGDDALSDGDLVKVARIPEGATFVSGRIIVSDLGANTNVISVGHGTASNQFLTGEDATSAIDKWYGEPTTFDSDTDITVLYGSAGADADANSTIKSVVVYVSE